jgi:hypothetical protein
MIGLLHKAGGSGRFLVSEDWCKIVELHHDFWPVDRIIWLLSLSIGFWKKGSCWAYHGDLLQNGSVS